MLGNASEGSDEDQDIKYEEERLVDETCKKVSQSF